MQASNCTQPTWPLIQVFAYFVTGGHKLHLAMWVGGINCAQVGTWWTGSGRVPDRNTPVGFFDFDQLRTEGFLGGYQTVPSGHSAPSKEGYRTNWRGGSKANWRQWIVINQERWFNDKSVPPNEILQLGFTRGCSDFKKLQHEVALAWNGLQLRHPASWMLWNLSTSSPRSSVSWTRYNLLVCFGM